MRTIEEDINNYFALIKKWIVITTVNPDELKHTGLKIRFLEINYAVKSIKEGDFQKSRQHFYHIWLKFERWLLSSQLKPFNHRKFANSTLQMIWIQEVTNFHLLGRLKSQT